MSHRADASRYRRRIRNPAQHRRDHVAIFKRSGELGALLRIVPQPMQQLRPSPLRRVNASAPVDRFQLRGPCGARDLPGFFPSPVIAPQIIVVRAEPSSRPPESRSTRSYPAQSPPRDPPETAAASSALRIASVSARKLIRMALRRIIGIVALTRQRIFRRRGPRRPFALSTIDTRTLSVPKSTPATIAISPQLIESAPVQPTHPLSDPTPRNSRRSSNRA